MTPTNFPEANGMLLGGPGALYGTRQRVDDMAVHRNEQAGTITSCWRPTLRERLRILLGWCVWVHVKARRTSPPIAVDTVGPITGDGPP